MYYPFSSVWKELIYVSPVFQVLYRRRHPSLPKTKVLYDIFWKTELFFNVISHFLKWSILIISYMYILLQFLPKVCLLHFNSVQSLSRVQLFATPWIAARQASLSITISWSSLRLTFIESVMPSSHLIFCPPLLLLSPILSSIRVLSNESTLHMRWPRYWSFSLSIIPSKGIPGLISFRMDWLDLLAVQWNLKSLLQHHSSKASILQRSAFFTVQLSHPYMTTGKTIALTRRTLVGIGSWIYPWAFYFVLLIYISVFVPVPYSLGDCSFVVEPEVRQIDSSSSILLSQDCFGYLKFFVFP